MLRNESAATFLLLSMTKIPLPCCRSRNPFSTRALIASLVVVLLTLKRLDSSDSLGRYSPTLNVPFSIISCISFCTCWDKEIFCTCTVLSPLIFYLYDIILILLEYHTEGGRNNHYFRKYQEWKRPMASHMTTALPVVISS